MVENIYTNYSYRMSELSHKYGPNVRLSSNPLLLTQLAHLSRPGTIQPQITTLIKQLYRSLTEIIIANEFPTCPAQIDTRMIESTPKGVWRGDVINPETPAVTAGIARAGTLPSQVVFEALTEILNPTGVRQDHIYMARVTDETGAVSGVSVAGNKIGGDIKDAVLILPDPMGATGGSMSKAISMYKEIGAANGAPLKIVTMNLIITPEYIQRITTEHPDVLVYGLRLDRGLSSPQVLQTLPGELWNEEIGLNQLQYIVPGAGGVGEIMNNSFV